MSMQPAVKPIRSRVREKQEAVSEYLRRVEREGNAWTILNIVGGALAALLTAVVFPVVGEPAIPVAAGVISTAAVVAAGVHRARVESCLAEVKKLATRLEGLDLLLHQGRLTDAEAAEKLADYVSECRPIPEPRGGFPLEAATGTIRVPRNGKKVGNLFTTHGVAAQVGYDVHLWLTVDMGEEIWPKTGRIYIRNGKWKQQVWEAHAERFDLTLWAVSADVDAELREWLAEGLRTGAFESLSDLPGIRIARVERLQRKLPAPAAPGGSFLGRMSLLLQKIFRGPHSGSLSTK